MHYSWWLLGLREKGLCSISVFEASTLSPERERAREIESETGGVSRAGGVAFPEGRSQEKAAGGCQDMEGGQWRKGDRTGWLAISKWIPFRRRTPLSLFSSLDPLCGFSSSSFLSSRGTQLGWINPVPVFSLLHVTERERERERERKRGGRRDRKREKVQRTKGTLLNWMEKPVTFLRTDFL